MSAHAPAPPHTRRRPRPAEVAVWAMDGAPYPGADYAQRLIELLEAAGIRARRVCARTGPPSRGRAPAGRVHLLSGGDTPAGAGAPWLFGVRRALAALAPAVAAGRASVIGICLGGQLVARTLAGPGAVRPCAAGLEIGMSGIAPVGGGPALVTGTFHCQEIAPWVGGVRYANAHSPVQVADIAPGWRAVQGHPELGPHDMLRLLAAHEQMVAAFGLRPTQVADQIEAAAAAGCGPDPFAALVADPIRAALAGVRHAPAAPMTGAEPPAEPDAPLAGAASG